MARTLSPDSFDNQYLYFYHLSSTRRSDSTTPKMLYLIGLGLADEKDISVKGLEVVKRAERVYLEAYTAILLVDKEQIVSSSSNSRHARAHIG